MEEYLTPNEVAERFRVTPHAVRDWCRQGRLKALRIGRRWRIKATDLEAFIEEQQEAHKNLKKADGLAAFAC